jgi:SMODS and SLOG-associating 2TM effector domain 3/SMODS and SLOG-associating 2TM effector domain 1
MSPVSDRKLCVTSDELPAVYRSADSVSLKAQERFVSATLLSLCALVVGAVVSAGAPTSPDWKAFVAWLSAAFLAISLVLTLAIKAQRKEKIWYSGRALAESAKTLAWRYMTAAEPFGKADVDANVDDRFLKALGEVLKAAKTALGEGGGASKGDDQITATMRAARERPLSDRIEVYVRCRIDQQRNWYSSKADANADLADRYYWYVIAAQVAALILALVRVHYPDESFHAAGPLAALSAALIAWTQLKRYQEHAQAYSVASHELGLIKERARHLQGEAEFSAFVGESENAISREHILWLARRDS